MAARTRERRRDRRAFRGSTADAVHRQQPRPCPRSVRGDPGAGGGHPPDHADVRAPPPRGLGKGAEGAGGGGAGAAGRDQTDRGGGRYLRSEEHTSELQSLMRTSYAVFCVQKKNNKQEHVTPTTPKQPPVYK